MKNSLSFVVNADGPKNAAIVMSGMLKKDFPISDVLLFKELNPVPKAIRIESIVFAIQEKMGFQLYWKTPEGYEIIMPLESRGYFNFETMQGYHSPRNAIGLAMSSFGCDKEKSFCIFLDITKQ